MLDGANRLGVNTFGLRLAGMLAFDARYSLEAALQNGKVGPAGLSSGAVFGAVSRRWTIAHKTLDISSEYKYASGTANPADPNHSGTFDQLYAANHDKFGREDLFGWRNLHNARSLTTLEVTKSVSLSFMYNNYWLAAPEDGRYSGSGQVITRSATGSAGRHVGQEADVFGTYQYKHSTFGAGYGYFFPGQFIRQTTPGAGPNYLYVFHSYSL